MAGFEVEEEIKARGYTRPEVLVSTDWVARHLEDPRVRIVESDEDVLLYDQGHIPGAVRVDWHADLQDPQIRDFIDQKRFASLCSRLGISRGRGKEKVDRGGEAPLLRDPQVP